MRLTAGSRYTLNATANDFGDNGFAFPPPAVFTILNQQWTEGEEAPWGGLLNGSGPDDNLNVDEDPAVGNYEWTHVTRTSRVVPFFEQVWLAAVGVNLI